MNGLKSIFVSTAPKSLSEVLIFASTTQYDNRLFIKLQVQYMKIPCSNLGRRCCVQKLILTFRTIFVHNMFSPCSAKRRASDKDLPVKVSILIEFDIFMTANLRLIINWDTFNLFYYLLVMLIALTHVLFRSTIKLALSVSNWFSLLVTHVSTRYYKYNDYWITPNVQAMLFP